MVGLKERHVRDMLDALAKAGHLQVIQIVDERHQDQRRNGYRIILKDAEGVTERISPSQQRKDEQNQCSENTDVPPEHYAENLPDLADTGTAVPVNSGTTVPVNTGATVPVNLKEENPIELNTRSFERERGARAAFIRARMAFEGRPPPDFRHAPTTVSAEARVKMGLPDKPPCEAKRGP